MVPTRNRTEFLEKTLLSVLAQDPGPERMQIEVVDDASSEGDAEGIVQALGKGRIAFHRLSENLGMGPCWNVCVSRARGHWVHLLHDDDIVRPNFYREYECAQRAFPEVDFWFCRAAAIDRDGRFLSIMHDLDLGGPDGVRSLLDVQYFLAKGNFVVTPTPAIRRELYERSGGFPSGFPFITDVLTWLNLARNGTFGYIPSVLLDYRMHQGSATTSLFVRGGKGLEEVLSTMAIRARLGYSERLGSPMKNVVAGLAYGLNSSRHRLHAEGFHLQGLNLALWSFRLKPERVTFSWVLHSWGLMMSRFWTLPQQIFREIPGLSNLV